MATAKQKEESHALIGTLQQEQASLARQVELLQAKEEDINTTHDRRCKTLVNKLNQVEDEHSHCK